MNKGIIILGSAGSGKTTLEKELFDWNYNFINFNRLNPDDYVELEGSEFYNNPLKASNWVYKIRLPHIIEDNENFILQNTGANTKTLRKITETPNYQFKAVIVYCNPIIAFIRNFSRDRKLPKQVLLENWLKVYSQIEEYTDMVGSDNIYVYETEYTQEELYILHECNIKDISVFNYLKDFDVSSSFKKETTKYTLEQTKTKQIKFEELLKTIDNSKLVTFSIMRDKVKYLDYIKEELNKWIK